TACTTDELPMWRLWPSNARRWERANAAGSAGVGTCPPRVVVGLAACLSVALGPFSCSPVWPYPRCTNLRNLYVVQYRGDGGATWTTPRRATWPTHVTCTSPWTPS